MAVERAELASSLTFEQMEPVSRVPSVQGQSSQNGGEGKPRRRAPSPVDIAKQEVSEKAVDETEERIEDELPLHRVDSLA
jgi:hypothetical protein